jgi:hypothetical protein
MLSSCTSEITIEYNIKDFLGLRKSLLGNMLKCMSQHHNTNLYDNSLALILMLLCS